MDLIIVDCQNDFVDGALAAPNGPETVEKIVDFLNDSDEKINTFYTADFHPKDHMSFSSEGGVWPSHCVENTFGSEIHEAFENSRNPVNKENLYIKGRNKDVEEYSGFEAENLNGDKLKDQLDDTVYIVGIASEYCVRETALAFKDAGKNVVVLKDLLGYINLDDHLENLKDLETKGIEIK